MPRRPNTKNLPSRLFEESSTPIYMVDANYLVTYANQPLADLFEAVPDQLVGQSLKYQAEENTSEDISSKVFVLCPPPSLIQGVSNGSVNEREDVVGNDQNEFCFSVNLPTGQKCIASSVRLNFEDSEASPILLCSLEMAERETHATTDPHWMHGRIQQYRVEQSSKHSAIPFLGESFSARRCFAQARSYALVESNVSVVGHPESQILDVAKSIHYSGFTNLDEPEPLLPINCQQVNGERIQEILVGHCQVNLTDSPDSKAHVLLLHADKMDSVAQRDLLTMVNLDQIQLRLIVTSGDSLLETEGFDEELAHRLSTLELRIPDLADRRSDVPLLAQYILEQTGSMAISFSEELRELLQVYPWASDYRELESIIESAADRAEGGEITLADCPHDFRMALKALDNPVPKPDSIDLDQLLADIEKEAIARAITHANGNKTVAAKMLGITRARLHRKIAESSDSAGDAK